MNHKRLYRGVVILATVGFIAGTIGIELMGLPSEKATPGEAHAFVLGALWMGQVVLGSFLIMVAGMSLVTIIRKRKEATT